MTIIHGGTLPLYLTRKPSAALINCFELGDQVCNLLHAMSDDL